MNAQQNMATFSFLLGILSLIMLLFGLGLPAGALGLIVALLSRGKDAFLPKAKIGFILSLIGLIISLVITVSSVILIRSGALQNSYEQMKEMIETNYGGSDTDELVEQLGEMFGITPEPADDGGEGK